MLMFRVADARETGMIGMNDGLVVHVTTVHADAWGSRPRCETSKYSTKEDRSPTTSAFAPACEN
jgi:hypothetical protein